LNGSCPVAQPDISDGAARFSIMASGERAGNFRALGPVRVTTG
jgi:hypothetical protein